MSEETHIENRTAQLARRVELLVNRLPAGDQGQEKPEAKRLRQITLFNESLAKELGLIREKAQEELKSIHERSRALSQDQERLRLDTQALEKNKTENIDLEDRLSRMLGEVSDERSKLAEERESVGSRAAGLAQREEALRAKKDQLGRDREAWKREKEQAVIAHQEEVKGHESRARQRADEQERNRSAHENNVKQQESLIEERRDELRQSIIAHQKKVEEAESRIQKRREELDGKNQSLVAQLEEISRQRQEMESKRAGMLSQSAEITRREGQVAEREKKVSTREEQVSESQGAVKKEAEQCREFSASHNGKVELFESLCADYEDKQKQLDQEKQRVARRDGTITAKSAQLAQEQQTAQGLRERLSEAESEAAAHGKEVTALRQASSELGDILRMLENLSVSGKSMNSAAEAMRTGTESVTRLDKELSSRLAAHDAAEKDLAAARADINRLRDDVAAKSGTVERLEQELWASKEQLSTSEDKRKSAERRVSALEEQLSASQKQEISTRQALQKTAHDARDSLSEQSRQMENLRGEADRLREQARQGSSELDAARSRVCTLERDLEAEREKNKSMAHSRAERVREEERLKGEMAELADGHKREIQRLRNEHAQAVEALEIKHSQELRELEGAGRHQRAHRRSLPLLTPSTTVSASFYRAQPTGPSEWQLLLETQPVEDPEAREFLESIEPSIADEDIGNFTIPGLLPHIASIAPNPKKRERVEAFLKSNKPGWFCFVLLGKLGHEDPASWHAETRCTYRLHHENCIQVRLREDMGPRCIEFRTFHVE